MDEPIIALEPGERLLWSGRPQRVFPTGLEWFRIVAGSVVVAGFAAAAGLPVPDGGFPVVIAVMAAIGLAVVGAPVLWRLRRTRRAVYAVTDQRIVVADCVSGHTRTSEYLSELEAPAVQHGRDGAGTLTFTRRDAFMNVLGVPVPVRNGAAPIELFVPDVDELWTLIVEAQIAD